MPKGAGEKNALPSGLSVSQLLPAERDYYRFNGSLTTPPCSEGVWWLVLKKTGTASKAQIEQFKSGNSDNYAHGTPLSHLPFMDPALVENLKKIKIYTAEQFEVLEGVGLQAVGMGAAQSRDKVVNWLRASKGAAPLQKLADEKEHGRASR